MEVYDCMTTELFEDEQGQAVRLPEACRFKGEEVVIGKVDELVVLAPKDSKWASFLESFALLSNDFFSRSGEPLNRPGNNKQTTTANSFHRTGAVLFVVLSCE